ncbi:large-conductance mechanosensitive channel [Nemania sp. FL0916]|nr:large-conductance mechanosensitive channel [Nemania sp. FL0916]
MPLPFRSSDANDERRGLLEQGEAGAKRIVTGFVDFVFSGNILEIAFGLILANAFTTVTNSFVNDILLPPLSVILPLNRNLDEKFVVLRPGPKYDEEDGYNTIKLAQQDGAVVLAYGGFIRHVVSFMFLGIMLYAVASLYQYLSKDPIIKHMIKCRYCRKYINEKAKRCINCTSWLDGREDKHIDARQNTQASEASQ